MFATERPLRQSLTIPKCAYIKVSYWLTKRQSSYVEKLPRMGICLTQRVYADIFHSHLLLLLLSTSSLWLYFTPADWFNDEVIKTLMNNLKNKFMARRGEVCIVWFHSLIYLIYSFPLCSYSTEGHVNAVRHLFLLMFEFMRALHRVEEETPLPSNEKYWKHDIFYSFSMQRARWNATSDLHAASQPDYHQGVEICGMIDFAFISLQWIWGAHPIIWRDHCTIASLNWWKAVFPFNPRIRSKTSLSQKTWKISNHLSKKGFPSIEQIMQNIDCRNEISCHSINIHGVLYKRHQLLLCRQDYTSHRPRHVLLNTFPIIYTTVRWHLPQSNTSTVLLIGQQPIQQILHQIQHFNPWLGTTLNMMQRTLTNSCINVFEYGFHWNAVMTCLSCSSYW